MKELSSQLQDAAKETDDSLKIKVETHLNQITAQINRLKIVKVMIIIRFLNLLYWQTKVFEVIHTRVLYNVSITS